MINVARWFSYCRAVEADRDYWRAKADDWQNYALTRSGQPPLSIVTAPKIQQPAPPPRPSLLGIRRRFAREAAIANNGDNGHDTRTAMEREADEYAARVKEG